MTDLVIVSREDWDLLQAMPDEPNQTLIELAQQAK